MALQFNYTTDQGLQQLTHMLVFQIYEQNTTYYVVILTHLLLMFSMMQVHIRTIKNN